MTGARGVRGEAAEVMRCLRESLREPAFAAVLVLLVSEKGKGDENNLADSGIPGVAY
jgi:hypothetical protein